jgi:hypothetical protein
VSAGPVFTAASRLYDRVPLASAVLCQDCGVISNAPEGTCVHCASAALLALAGVLDRDVKKD